MAIENFSFWDKVIYSLFSAPAGVLLGLLLCWALSNYYANIKGLGVYLIALVLGVCFTSLLCFIFPSLAAKILTFIVKL